MQYEDPQLPVDDRIRVRIFTLADHVANPPDGKLYIAGAGVSQILMPVLPGPLLGISLALRLYVPWNELTEPHTLRVRLLDEDRNAVGDVRDPILDVPIELGKAAGSRPGDEAGYNMSMNLNGLPIPYEGVFFIHLEVDGQLLDRHALRVRRAHPMQAFGLPG